MTIDVHPIRPEDEADWRRVWKDYLDFYNSPLTPAQTDLTWARMLDADHPINGFLARASDGKAVGMVTYLYHVSTWIEVGDCYLEDLYVDADVRGGGIGRALIEAVKQAAEAKGCERLYWFTDEGNDRARILYDKIVGGTCGHVRYRMSL